MAVKARDELLARLKLDLVGPENEDELLPDKPSDRYLTGILYPQRHEYGPEEDEGLGVQDDDAEASGDAAQDDTPGLIHARRPASAGISFALETDDGEPELVIRVSCGTYRAIEKDGERLRWQRDAHQVELQGVRPLQGPHEISLDQHGLPGMRLFKKCSNWENGLLVTMALVNAQSVEKDDQRRDMEEKIFFQTRLEIRPRRATRIRAKPSIEVTDEMEQASAALIYRNACEFAVGHTCSAGWRSENGITATSVHTTWIPEAVVPRTSSRGDEEFRVLEDRSDGLEPLAAGWLSEAGSELLEGLRLLPGAYEKWISSQSKQAEDLPETLKAQATLHLERCREVAKGMRAGIRSIESDEAVRESFRLANRAMLIQRRWLHPEEPAFSWRPFQLAFMLLSLPSLVDPEHPDREVMDLLWFPTGGGKTEAYLSLIAFTIFHRRLRKPDDPDAGAGVAVIMRYTLRLLTAQQFQRACALVLACEYLRQGRELPKDLSPDCGDRPFSVGLWVGRDATSNKMAEAVTDLASSNPNSPAQLEDCPACRERLKWFPLPDESEIHVACRNRECPLGSLEHDLPVWTVDEDVYRETPSLVIGTADKFAQIVRQPKTARLFGIGTDHEPPELIIQDELHLISGPLGTLAGIYEAAVDELCGRVHGRPKLIGSTATIRRAEPQVRALFDRGTRQFPPLGLDAGDSGFAVVDEEAPGRLYVGVSTAGRSAKFTLQAVSASLLQSASSDDIRDESRDGYWTLVAYFNSLRELGGALVLMRDDVGRSIEDYASRRDEEIRTANIIEELTSRRTQLEIRDQLKELGREWPDPGTIDALLATNMISVGVDIPRLGLMVVNGQPKAIAEYIQATSRVGRSDAPGLIVSIYNNAKARDRSHYETFVTWHSTLYREVEASSVTPFASRARDRALHSPLVALVRHTVAGMTEGPTLNREAEQEARQYADRIVERARRIDPEEADSVAGQLEDIISEWAERTPISTYWNDYRPNTSLLISAEKAAAMQAAGRLPGRAWSTPNSLRNVDPGTPFVLADYLRPRSTED